MVAPTKMTANMLDALKGWPRPSALDFNAKMSAAAKAFFATGVVPAGTVVHLNATSGEYELGVTDTQMPLFIWQGSNDPDVANDGGDPATDSDLPWVATGPTGEIMALVATGAYELWSTQYVTASYPRNTLLTSLTTGDDRGKLQAGTLNTHNICGCVSRGLITRWNKSVLTFWPVFFPKGI